MLIKKSLEQEQEVNIDSQDIKPIDEVPTIAKRVAQPFERRGRGRTQSSGLSDRDWARHNLRRYDQDKLILDLANVLRVLERNPDYSGRFRYNQDMAKVVDRGVIMAMWMVNALAGEIQERFMPSVNENLVHKAIEIVANKATLSQTVNEETSRV